VTPELETILQSLGGNQSKAALWGENTRSFSPGPVPAKRVYLTLASRRFLIAVDGIFRF
jgi:hypothetical protein